MGNLLVINSLTVRFGGVVALSDISLNIGENKIVGLIGPNGSGKTTLINTVTGICHPEEGEVLFSEGNTGITHLKPHAVARKGISRTFQKAEPFLSLTVLENVVLGRYSLMREGLFKSAFRFKNRTAWDRKEIAKSLEILKLVGLEDMAGEDVSKLTFAQLRLLELARALAIRPRLLLLDEPAAGMNLMEVSFMNGVLKKVRDDFRIAILVIEHNMKMIMEICDWIYVLNFGKKICEGPVEEVSNDQRVIEAYLGR